MPITSGDFTSDPPTRAKPKSPLGFDVVFNAEQKREEARGDLARGLLWLLTFCIGGVLAFVGLGRLDGTVITQSIFPSLVALTGTALGFYFGSQTAKSSDSGTAPNPGPTTITPASGPTTNPPASEPTTNPPASGPTTNPPASEGKTLS